MSRELMLPKLPNVAIPDAREVEVKEKAALSGSDAVQTMPRRLDVSNRGGIVEEETHKLVWKWRDCFLEAPQWLDSRGARSGPRHPDFRHRTVKDTPRRTPEEEEEEEEDGRNWNSVSENLVRRCEVGELGEAVDALELLLQRGGPSCVRVWLVCRLLKRCVACRDMGLGKRVHAAVVETGYELDAFLATHIVGMYAAHGRLEEAAKVVAEVSAPDAHLWSAVILAHARQGRPVEAVRLYRKMRGSDVKPDNYVFVAVLQACAAAQDLVCGKEVHADILAGRLGANHFVGNSLVNMYAKCGCLERARQVFDNLPKRDVVTWTAMIAGYTQQGLGGEALALYARMQQEGLAPPDRVTFLCLLQACISIQGLLHGKELHAQILERGFEDDVVIGSCLVAMYAKCGSVEDARRVFERLPKRSVVTWNAMMAGYVQHGLDEEALHLYAGMQLEGLTPASQGTYVCLLHACATVGALRLGQHLHEQARQSGLDVDLVVGNCLVDMYSKCGSVEDARSVFDRLSTRDVVTWTAMIAGYAQQGRGGEALCLYASMRQEGITPATQVTFVCLLQACATVGALATGKELHAQIQEMGLEADVSIGSSLVDMYAKCGILEDARRVFERLPARNLVTWTAMITGYSQHGLGQEALDLYGSMQQEALAPADRVTFACLLQACGSVGALQHGMALHSQIQQRGLDTDVLVGNCLVDMYSKCGSLQAARRVFDALPTRDVVTWTSIITAYVQEGKGQDALSLYATMEREGFTLPNHVTFVCLLQACASVGALHQGRRLHEQIQLRGLESHVAVGNCLVDMYSKCGSVEDARMVFDRLPTRDVVTWSALLKGYAEHGHGLMAIQCFEEMLQEGVEPDEITFICLLVACSHAGLVHEGQRYFRMMVEDHGIVPTDVAYNCLVDLLGRSGRLDEAEDILQSIPLDKYVVGWTSLLSACKGHNDADRGRRYFDHLVVLQPQVATSYVLLGNIYASTGRWNDANRVERLRKSAGAWKKPAKACIEVKNKVHEFTVGEERSEISSKLSSVNLRLKEEGGHVPQTDLVLKALSEREKEDALCGHAEKLALAFGLLNTPDGSTLLVTKNLRMCNDCHSSTKVLSRLEKREIIVRDAHRVHCFVNGSCSCGDRP